MGTEFERKFIFKNPKDAEKILKEHSAEDKVTKIEQIYLIVKYAKLKFDA